MNRHFMIIWVGIGLLLGACSMTSPYTRPEAPVAETWPGGPAYGKTGTQTDAPGATDIPWQEFFVDERLQGVIETALDNNRDLRLAALNVQRARAIYGIQRSALFPALDATANGSKQRVPADLSSSGERYTAEQYDVNLGVYSWEIDFFGRLRSLKDQALETFMATEEARRSTQILIVSEVANTYLTLAANRENLRLAQTTFEAQTATYDLIKRRYEVGLATELDLNRVQTQVDIARRNKAIYTQRVAHDDNALKFLVGSPSPVSIDNMPEDLAGIAPLKAIETGIPSEVLLNRPDILQAEHLLKAANANIGAARAALFPRISLTSTVGTASAELSGLFDAGSGTWLLAPQIVMPIFDARLWSALDVTKAEQEITLVQYEKAIQAAFREVADTLATKGTVDEQLAAQQSLVRAAAETYRLSEARYIRGVDNYLGVLVSQRSLFAAQQGLVGLKLSKRANQVQLYAVLGGGGR